jgi:hypothetical protein
VEAQRRQENIDTREEKQRKAREKGTLVVRTRKMSMVHGHVNNSIESSDGAGSVSTQEEQETRELAERATFQK